MISFSVERSVLEEFVGKPRAAVMEFNDSVYPALLGEFAGEQQRLVADQRVIDRLMSGWPEDEQRGPVAVQNITA
jgi:hypothetical protein